MASMRAELRGLPRFYWPGWAQAADYWLHHGGSLDEAQRMADHAVSLKENFITVSVSAAVAEQRGDTRRAAALRERAFAIGSEQEINDTMSRMRAEKEAMLKKRFEQAKKAGDLPKTANPATLARYLATMAAGISMQASTGASARELREVAGLALANWPAAQESETA